MPAAGSGRRFGGAIPKQYLELCGRAVIEHALAPFLADARCRGVVVALDPGDMQFRRLALAGDVRVRSVNGGAERSDSVRNALAALSDGGIADAPVAAADEDWVLVHDAARPCLTREDLDFLLDTLQGDAVGGLLAIALADTLKRASGHNGGGRDGTEHRVAETAPRDCLWRALTPQMFRLGALRAALQRAAAEGRHPTDEAQAMEWDGQAPRLVAGRADNLKITSPADLPLAAAVLTGRMQT